MLSRDADSCFWIGRYIERAEATARMIDVHFHFGLETGSRLTRPWSSTLQITGEEGAFAGLYPEENDRNVVEFFCFDDRNPNSILRCVTSTRENARSIREAISSEMWESLNAFYLELRGKNWEAIAGSPHQYFQWVKNQSHLFQGITNRTLMMGESRDFLDAGRFLERALQTTRILDVRYHDLEIMLGQTQGLLQTPDTAEDEIGSVHAWISVLKSVGAYEAFRKTTNAVQGQAVAEFLLLHPAFPASVRHSVERVQGCLKRIGAGRPLTSADRKVGRLWARLAYTAWEDIGRDGLKPVLAEVRDQCNAVGVAIADAYLRY